VGLQDQAAAGRPKGDAVQLGSDVSFRGAGIVYDDLRALLGSELGDFGTNAVALNRH
jgi:hypothetical protein